METMVKKFPEPHPVGMFNIVVEQLHNGPELLVFHDWKGDIGSQKSFQQLLLEPLIRG
jgi:hypothetical protein